MRTSEIYPVYAIWQLLCPVLNIIRPNLIVICRMNQTAMNLDHLLAIGQATDAQIVEHLVQTYYTMLYRLGLHLLRYHDGAKDAAQETLITASQKIEQYQIGTER